MESNRYAETSHKDRSFQWIVRYDEFRLVTCLFRKVQIFISQSTDFHFAKYRFPFRKVQISISQITDFHFAKYRFPFRFVPFRFAKYNKPNLRASEACEACESDVRGTQISLKNTPVSLKSTPVSLTIYIWNSQRRTQTPSKSLKNRF